jgi:predicted house-cleaning noncanonical NTP pyrophosphatase (MazG superfamily)
LGDAGDGKEEMKKIYYNKLVMDKIPQRIKDAGGKFSTKKLSNQDFKTELLKKVGEESDGVVGAKGRDEIISEMGDILDVLVEVKKNFKISEAEIRSAQKTAFEKKGGFQKKLFLVWSEDTGYKSNERKYSKKK